MILWKEKQAPEAPPLLDTAYLERLQKHLGVDVTRELMADGMLELADRMNRLPAMAAERKSEDIARLAHDIAGAAGHLGLSRLSYHATEVNRELREKPARPLEEVIAPLVACKGGSLDALGRFCRGQQRGDSDTGG